MATAVDRYDNGTIYALTETDRTIGVALGVSVVSLDFVAIVGSYSNQTVAVNGYVHGAAAGIALENFIAPGTPLSGQSITIGARGSVSSGTDVTDVGISLTSNRSSIVNAGYVFGYTGILMNGVLDTANPTAQSQIINTGTIQGINFGIDRLTTATEKMTIVNKGLIAGQSWSINGGGIATEIVINQGKLKGVVDLGFGDDLFDNRGGTLLVRVVNGVNYGIGPIVMGMGNDRVVPGAAREIFFGGDGSDPDIDSGTDTIDFRFGAGITFALDGSLTATGVAAGDQYRGFEAVWGSLKGNDFLRGSGALGHFADSLYGFGGNDKLEGLAGADTLVGGAGRDRLVGGLGDDVFLYNAPSEGRDFISDFSNATENNDMFKFRLAGFKSGLAAGELAVERFHIGRSNRATERDDRFIYDTKTTTLWFDADGSGRKAPVLIADLQAGASVTYSDINMF